MPAIYAGSGAARIPCADLNRTSSSLLTVMLCTPDVKVSKLVTPASDCRNNTVE